MGPLLPQGSQSPCTGDTVKGRDTSLGLKEENSDVSWLITQHPDRSQPVSPSGLILRVDQLPPKEGDVPGESGTVTTSHPASCPNLSQFCFLAKQHKKQLEEN